MDFIVRVWVFAKGSIPKTKYFEFMDLGEAQDFADRRTSEFRKEGVEFDVTIYEVTNL